MKRSSFSFLLGMVVTVAIGLAFMPAFTRAAVPVAAPAAIGTPFYSQLTLDMSRDPVLQRNCKAEFESRTQGAPGYLGNAEVNGGVANAAALYNAVLKTGANAVSADSRAGYAVCLSEQANRKLDYLFQAVKALPYLKT